MTTGLLSAFAAAVLYGVGTLLQAVGLRRATAHPDVTGWRRVRLAHLYVVGLVLDGFGFLASLSALRTLPLFVVESALASSVAVTAVLVVVFLGERLDRGEVLALAAVGAGLVALAASADPGGAVELGTAGGWVLLGAAGVVALGGLAALRSPSGGGPLLAVTAGLAFGGTGIAARVMVLPSPLWRVVLDPTLWALAAYAVIALVFYALALNRGSVTSAAAITFTVETVVPALIGLLWLGDRVRPGAAPLAAVAFVLTLGGCLRLARHSVVDPVPVR